MGKTLKILLFAVCELVGLLVLVAVVVVLFVDVNAYKPRVEASASDALGMEVRVDGRLRIGFFPGLHIILEDALDPAYAVSAASRSGRSVQLWQHLVLGALIAVDALAL